MENFFHLNKSLVFCIFSILSMCSFFSYYDYNLLQSNLILDVCFMFLSIINGSSVYNKVLPFLILSFLYLMYSIYYFTMFNKVASGSDFLLVYKPFLYIILLCFCCNKSVFSESFISNLFYMVCILYFIKYSIWLVIGNTESPGFFTENNFELMLPVLLYFTFGNNSGNLFSLFLLGLVVFFSGSSSGIAVFLFMVLFSDFSYFKYHRFFKIFAGMSSLLLVVYIFFIRLGNLSVSDMDSVVFLKVFLNEIASWTWYEYLFGNPMITHLSAQGANSLRFYHLLFSDYGNGIAYSVILHSFILSMIFDHGMMGLSFIFIFVYSVLKYSNYGLRVMFMICSVIFLNGLSVSSFGSVYFFIGLFFLLTKASKPDC